LACRLNGVLRSRLKHHVPAAREAKRGYALQFRFISRTRVRDRRERKRAEGRKEGREVTEGNLGFPLFVICGGRARTAIKNVLVENYSTSLFFMA
jgi:hypothetical protein